MDVPSIPNPFAKADEAKDAVSFSSFGVSYLAVEQEQLSGSVCKKRKRKPCCF